MTERKRANMFGAADGVPENGGAKLNLERFQPKMAPEIAPEIAHEIAAQQGFTTTHSTKKMEKRDGRKLKRSSRSVQFNVRLRPEVAERFWKWAEAEDMVYADDFLEHLIALYEQGRRNA